MGPHLETPWGVSHWCPKKSVMPALGEPGSPSEDCGDCHHPCGHFPVAKQGTWNPRRARPSMLERLRRENVTGQMWGEGQMFSHQDPATGPGSISGRKLPHSPGSDPSFLHHPHAAALPQSQRSSTPSSEVGATPPSSPHHILSWQTG